MKLYCFRESGNAYRAALLLNLLGIDWQPVWVDFFNGGTRTDAFRALNPMGEVPVLDDDGRILTQSAVILTHIARKAGQYMGRDQAEQDEVLRWLFWDAHKFTSNAASVRFLSNFLPADKRPQGAIAFQSARFQAACKVLDTHLAGRDWVVGDGPTIADIALCSYLYYPEPFGFDRAHWPAIARWLDRIAALPGWRAPHDLLPAGPVGGGAHG